MTASQSRKPRPKWRLPQMSSEDLEELRYLRAQFLSELADWILTHPAPREGEDRSPGTPARTAGSDAHVPGAQAPIPDEGHAGAQSSSGIESA